MCSGISNKEQFKMIADNTTKKFCIGIVVYKPTMGELNNIEVYAGSNLFGLVMIFDNSPERTNYQFKHESCQYHFQNENTGLAKPYNRMLQEAEAGGYDYLCIMDQDSSFKVEEIYKLIKAIENYGDAENVAAFCPIILKKGFQDYSRTSTWRQVVWTINSGSFLNVHCLRQHSIVYDEDVFLDGLDYDFGWTVHRKGCFIMQYCDSLLVQSFGYQTNENRTFTCHNAYRYYLIAHNRRHIFKKHFGIVRGLIYAQIKNMILSFRILLNEEDKCKKISACYKGMFR